MPGTNQDGNVKDALREVFERIAKAKHRRKELEKPIDEALEQTRAYVDVQEKIKALREKRSALEAAVLQQFPKEAEELERLKLSISTYREMLSEIALTLFMKGESVEIENQLSGVRYEPVFRVTFKKEQMTLGI